MFTSRLQSFFLLQCALLLLMLLVTGCSSGNGQPDAGEQISQVRSGDTDTVLFQQAPAAEIWSQLPSLEGLKKLEIEAGALTVEQIGLLAKCKSLDHLVIKGEVTSAQLITIAGCQGLRVLNVPNGTFDDAAFRQLTALSKLELLRVGSPEMTDKALREIGDFDSLRFLHVIGAPITDEGLKSLYEVKNLESLYIDESQVTDAGIGQLVEARRDLHVHVNQQHPDRADGHSHEH